MNRYVLNKISKFSEEKTELSEVEVNLGLFQDAQKMVTASEKKWLAANQKINIINTKVSETIQALNEASTSNADALKLVNTLIANTKQLGLEPNPETMKMFDLLTVRTKRMFDGLNKIKSIKAEQV